MVLEQLDKPADLEEENRDIKIRYPDFNNSTALRISLFKKGFSTKRGLATTQNSDFIGYAIVKIDELPSQGRMTRIYESVLHTSRHPNNCIRGMQKWPCNIMGHQLEVEGYLYAQQNNTTNVCAHVGLRTATARYHKNGDMSYHEMNELIGIDHVNNKVGGGDGRGLTAQEMVRILEAAGARCFEADYSNIENPPAPFHKYIYGSIESGFPAILCFGTTQGNTKHAIPIFGHTFNEDTWVPNADISYFRVGERTRYIPSESWLSMYIAHDDNWGSNYCIPRHYLHTNRICKNLDSDPVPCPEEKGNVVYVISTVPKEVKMSPIRAEVIGVDYLFTILPQMPDAQTPGEKD